MGVFKKLKDVLFDVEEEEIPVITKEAEPRAVKEVKKEQYVNENTIKEIKIPREEIPERELIKSESTFNFPLEVDEKPKTRVMRGFDFDDVPKKKTEPTDYSRILKEDSKSNKPFKPTPIISPVYGVLDQNYSKDDIIVKTDIGIKGPDLDAVRKKAYGIPVKEEKKKSEAKPDILDEPLKTLDEILMEEEQNKAELIKTGSLPNITINDIPEEPNTEDESKTVIDDTIETDLFNLIDSMYEGKEESEEE